MKQRKRVLRISVEHQIGELVYLKTDREKNPRIITRIFVSSEHVMYECSLGAQDTLHYAIELSPVEEIVQKKPGF
mgnify:FL=1